ncbi:MAG: transcriptional regulator [Kineothrix sp.]|nr:transcriptional regulator [Kineothrix sp.]
MPDLSILIQMAEFYAVDVKEILDGERKSGNMDKELKETLSKVADYNKLEKEKVNKAGNVAFGLAFAVCAAMIVIQLLMVGELAIVAGETVVLLVGGVAYIGVMTYNGVWETGSRFKSTPFTDALIAVLCAGVFAAALAICYISLGTAISEAVHSALIFFVGIALVGFGVLRTLAYFSRKRKNKKYGGQ